jgi:hypothetical protein
LVFFVFGVGEDLDEVVVAPDAAAVFGWAGAAAGEAAGVGDARFGAGDGFDQDGVFPATNTRAVLRGYTWPNRAARPISSFDHRLPRGEAHGVASGHRKIINSPHNS